MKQQNSKWMLLISALSATATLVQPLRAEVLEKSKRVNDTIVHYKIVLPNDYDPTKTYPTILAFGGGPQTMNTVDNILSRNFRAEAEKRGYIVVAPAAPDGEFVLRGWGPYLPRISENHFGGLQGSGQQVPHRGSVERGHRGASCGGRESAILPVRDCFPRIHVAAQRCKARADLEDVRVHVRR
jgi:hypothetical protein